MGGQLGLGRIQKCAFLNRLDYFRQSCMALQFMGQNSSDSLLVHPSDVLKQESNHDINC